MTELIIGVHWLCNRKRNQRSTKKILSSKRVKKDNLTRKKIGFLFFSYKEVVVLSVNPQCETTTPDRTRDVLQIHIGTEDG